MKVLRPLRRAATMPALLWLYRNRRPLGQVAQFGKSVPGRLRHGNLGELTLDARARMALISDPDLRDSRVRIKSVDGHRIVLRGSLDDPHLERARRKLEALGDEVQVSVFSGTGSAPKVDYGPC